MMLMQMFEEHVRLNNCSLEHNGGSMRAIRLSVILAVLILIPSIQGYSSGIGGPAVDSGCSCHGGGSSSDQTSLEISGIEKNWTADTIYNLTITIDGPESFGSNIGGFNIRASVGTLSSIDDSVQIVDGEATHTVFGNDQRIWNLTWTAPSYTGQKVIFTALGNAVNGDQSANSDDHWNVVVESVEGLETEEINSGFSTKEYIAITIGIGIALVFILTTESIRIELEEE
jgi:hypothetical protein